MSGETKTIRFADTLKLSMKQNMKGNWVFSEVTVQFNPLDEGMQDIIDLQIKAWTQKWEKEGRTFQKPVSPEIKINPKTNEITHDESL